MSGLDHDPSRDHHVAVRFRDGVPVSLRFDDPYYSLQDGAAESAHVFLAGNDLPARFCPGFHIGELGFGTGLNLLVALAAWDLAGLEGGFRFTSFEAFPLSAAQTAEALAALPLNRAHAQALTEAVAARRTRFEIGAAEVTLLLGDARDRVPAWPDRADAWFLDGFAPARNAELWDPELMAEIARHTAPGGSFATYTAAGSVRRALEAAGFLVSRRPGFGRKRHMTVGQKR